MREPFITDPYARYSPSENPASAGRYTVAAAVEGRLAVGKSLPSGGFIPEESGEPTRFIVVADQYFPSAMIEYTDSLGNMDFLVNCVLWLSGEDDLLLVKNRGNFDTRLNRITDTAAFARERGRALFVTLILLPALISGAGIAVYIARRRALPRERG
jgi:ABC-type uncharacterized transport system involved in gliding motility auxiliary subunit